MDYLYILGEWIQFIKVAVQNSKVIPLPVFLKNEARVSELTDVLREITKTLGYDTTNQDDFKMLEEIKILFGGDELSVRNAWIAMARQREALPQASLQYIEPVAGLFQVLTMLIQNHYGSPQDPNSISRWMNLLRNDARIWDTKRNTIKDSAHATLSSTSSWTLIFWLSSVLTTMQQPATPC